MTPAEFFFCFGQLTVGGFISKLFEFNRIKTKTKMGEMGEIRNIGKGKQPIIWENFSIKIWKYCNKKLFD